MLARQGVEPTEDEVELVQRRSEGWPAGLRLTAAATRHDPARAPGRASDADPYIAEYLTREVLADQPKDLYAVLLDAAVVPRTCAGLIEALTGRAHGDRLLKDLVEASLFLVPLDAAPGWYRYRPLFAQVDPRRVGEARACEDRRAAPPCGLVVPRAWPAAGCAPPWHRRSGLVCREACSDRPLVRVDRVRLPAGVRAGACAAQCCRSPIRKSPWRVRWNDSAAANRTTHHGYCAWPISQ